MEKYSWDFDGDAEFWNNDSHDTIEECVEDAIGAIADGEHGYAEPPTVIYIAENVAFVPQVDACHVLEAIEEQAAEQCGEVSEGWDTYDYKKKDEIEELEEALSKVVIDWLEKYGRAPSFWSVENIKEYPLNLDAGAGKR